MSFDDASRNTAENAAFVAALVGVPLQGRWLLVASAFHMPRAQGLFRKAGLNLDAYPVAFRTAELADQSRWSSCRWRSGSTWSISPPRSGSAFWPPASLAIRMTCFPLHMRVDQDARRPRILASSAILWSNLLTKDRLTNTAHADR